MTQKPTIHVIASDDQFRHEQFLTLTRLGYHVESYCQGSELIEFHPREGVILICDKDENIPFERQIQFLNSHRISLPVLVASSSPKVRNVIAAIRSGAQDYLDLPLDCGETAELIGVIIEEAASHAEARRTLMAARDRLSRLSVREREVLDLIVDGNSNKEIARSLQISPRTVEIHRANLMSKLEAKHPAEVVRIAIAAGGQAALAG